MSEPPIQIRPIFLAIGGIDRLRASLPSFLYRPRVRTSTYSASVRPIGERPTDRPTAHLYLAPLLSTTVASERASRCLDPEPVSHRRLGSLPGRCYTSLSLSLAGERKGDGRSFQNLTDRNWTERRRRRKQAAGESEAIEQATTVDGWIDILLQRQGCHMPGLSTNVRVLRPENLRSHKHCIGCT